MTSHSFPALQRAVLLALGLPSAALGLPACGKPDPTCEEVDEVTADYTPTSDTWLLCDEPGELGGAECPTQDDAWAAARIVEVLGSPDTTDCTWSPKVVCGPEAAEVDRCCYTIEPIMGCVTPGRPFTVQGGARIASLHPGAGWAEAPAATDLPPATRQALADGWTRMALGEHASIASFARVVLGLLAHGAPAELVAGSTRAQSDEILHASRCFSLASRYAGTTLKPGPIDVAGALALPDLAALVVDTFREGCINETIAAAQAAAARDLATDPQVRKALERIAEDEQRHAALAWRTLRWALERDPQLRGLVAEGLVWRAPASRPDPEGADPALLRAHGLLDATQLAQVARITWREIIEPAARALLHAPTELHA